MDQALYEELLPLLGNPRQAASGRTWAFCPTHPDGEKHGRRSLSLDLRYGLVCFAGCEFKALLEALRAGQHRNGYQPEPGPKAGTLTAVYEYRDEGGELIAEKCRIEHPDGHKTFRWRLPGGEWEAGLGNLKLRDIPLYGAEVAAKADKADPVWFVEGEKAQRAMALQGFLSVTHGGGASTKDVGTSLEVLRGRTVLLWPDNDPPGRAFMNVVAARLRSVAVSVRYVNCPIALPEKGDADDYFARGGTPEALKQTLVGKAGPVEPTTELLADDALVVTLPSITGGALRFEFLDIETSGRRFDAELTIRFDGPKDDSYAERVNLLSSTQRTELRRELDSLYGKDHDWTRLLHTAFGLARNFYARLDRALDVSDAPQEGPDRFAVDPFLPMDAITIWFGDGGSAKTMLACALAEAFCLGHRFANADTPGLPVLFVDWEDTFATFARRIRRLGGGPEMMLGKRLIQYWPAKGIPLVNQIDAIKRKVETDGIGLVIYDSVALACDGPPEESQSCNRFINAARKTGVTSLCIAHITKRGEEDKPYGSAFWSNSARRTWLVKKADDEDTDTLDVALICKKVNDGRKPRSVPVRLAFTDQDGPIVVTRDEFDVGSKLSKAGMGLNARIRQALKRTAMTRIELAELLEEDEGIIRNTMNKRQNKAAYTPVGNKWGLATKDTE